MSGSNITWRMRDGIAAHDICGADAGWRDATYLAGIVLFEGGNVYVPYASSSNPGGGTNPGVPEPPDIPTPPDLPPLIKPGDTDPAGGIYVPISGKGCGMYYLGTYQKQPTEKLKYVLDYATWPGMGSDESINAAGFSVDIQDDPDDLVISGSYPDPDYDNRRVVFFASKGISGKEYQVTVVAETNRGQVIERELIFAVEEL